MGGVTLFTDAASASVRTVERANDETTICQPGSGRLCGRLVLSATINHQLAVFDRTNPLGFAGNYTHRGPDSHGGNVGAAAASGAGGDQAGSRASN